MGSSEQCGDQVLTAAAKAFLRCIASVAEEGRDALNFTAMLRGAVEEAHASVKRGSLPALSSADEQAIEALLRKHVEHRVLSTEELVNTLRGLAG